MLRSDPCVQYGKWIHGRFAGVKKVTPKFSRNFVCRKCELKIGEVMEQEEMLCDEVESVKEFTYIGYMVNIGKGCETAMTARSKCW